MTKKNFRTTTSVALVLSMTMPVGMPAPAFAQDAADAPEVTVPCGPDIEAPCLREDGTVLTPEEAEDAAKAEQKTEKKKARKKDKNAKQDKKAKQKKAAEEKPAKDAARPAKRKAPDAAAQPEATGGGADTAVKRIQEKLEKAQDEAEAPAKKAGQQAEEAVKPKKKAGKENAKAGEAGDKVKKQASDDDQLQEALDEANTDAPDENRLKKMMKGAEKDKNAKDAETAIKEPKTVISEETGLSEKAAEAEAEVAAEIDAEKPEAAAAATAKGNGKAKNNAKKPKVTVTEVTEADVRGSGEDFLQRAAKKKQAKKKKANKDKSSDDDNGGLSDLQKILLAAGGAAVVGAILNNGSKVVQNTGDRVVAQRDDGSLYVLKDDDALVARPGSKVETQTYDDGSTITTVTRQDGTQIRTIRDSQGRVLRRSRVLADGSEYLLIDDTADVASVDVSKLPRTRSERVDYGDNDGDLEAALNRELGIDRRFSLSQIRNIRAVRELVPQIDLESVTFDTGSAAIRPSEAKKLARLGQTMKHMIEERPNEVFLIEGHTDAVGSAVNNLTLSDRRAESLALALTEYFDIPPENMVVQGYGESYLKVADEGDVRANRRVAVRRITPLLGMQMASR